MQIDLSSQSIDSLIHGGTAGLILFGAYVAWKTRDLIDSMKTRLDRDESFHKEYPPHRHTNGTITYSPYYKPGKVEHMSGGD
jgi:hypothetical protein